MKRKKNRKIRRKEESRKSINARNKKENWEKKKR